jgi:hypothetical protein
MGGDSGCIPPGGETLHEQRSLAARLERAFGVVVNAEEGL